MSESATQSCTDRGRRANRSNRPFIVDNVRRQPVFAVSAEPDHQGVSMRMRIGAAVVAVASVVLAACSNPGSGNDNKSPAAWPAETAKLDGVNLTIWAAQNSNKTAQKVISDFEAATGAKIKVVTIPDTYEQDLQTKVASGDKPDLAFWQPTASELTSLNASNNLQPLDGAPWVSKFKPALQNITGELNGKRYAALVSSPAVEGVYYNKQVFAKYGISSTPRNFDGMIADARK